MPRTRDSTRKRRPTAKASAFRLGLRPPLRGTKYHNQVPNDDSALRNAHPSPKKRKRLSRRSTRQASESSERGTRVCRLETRDMQKHIPCDNVVKHVSRLPSPQKAKNTWPRNARALS
eukprot:scaffold3208_cov402-Prasinococcus_capsulatus_cf.AAC.8